jgi:hypothetical protein
MASSNQVTFFGSHTKVSETCLWIAEGYRRICVSYEYDSGRGVLKYAASIYRCERCDHDHCDKYIEITEEMMDAHDHTTTRRFELRPVIISVQCLMSYANIIKTIRYEMCHGYGCKGPRGLQSAFDGDVVSDDGANSKSSANDWESDNEFSFDEWMEHYTNVGILQKKTPRTLRYISHSSHENYMGVRRNVMREFFITFKACKRTGALIYAAAISRRPEELGPITDKDLVDNHFKTAISRLELRPVPMIVSEEFRHQLKKNAVHREDVMYEIIDKIQSRPGGKYLICGDW